MTKTFNLGEIAKIESITGRNLEDPDQPRGKYLAALVVVLSRREGNEVSLEQAYEWDAQEASDLIDRHLGDGDDPK